MNLSNGYGAVGVAVTCPLYGKAGRYSATAGYCTGCIGSTGQVASSTATRCRDSVPGIRGQGAGGCIAAGYRRYALGAAVTACASGDGIAGIIYDYVGSNIGSSGVVAVTPLSSPYSYGARAGEGQGITGKRCWAADQSVSRWRANVHSAGSL